MVSMRTSLLPIILITLLAVFIPPAAAQTPEPPSGPVYIVQEGDTLWDIAIKFNVTLTQILEVNNLPGEQIFVGDRIVIPGLQDVTGVLTIQPVPLGESIRSLSRIYDMSEGLLQKLNRIVSPNELYAGFGLILLQQEDTLPVTGRTTMLEGETFLEAAVLNEVAPWTFAATNHLDGTSIAIPGDVFITHGTQGNLPPNGLPLSVLNIKLDDLPITQGETAQVKVTIDPQATLAGTLAFHSLQFFQTEPGVWVALQGIHAMTQPGLYPFRLDSILPDGTHNSFEQMVLVQDGYFRQDPILVVEPSTIDPAVTEPENEFLASITSIITSEKKWQGTFLLPVDQAFCIRSMYGNRRSYNGSDFIYFHTGVDYGVCSDSHPFDIYAPAAGKVVFAGPLTVRGNATIIDHGWGIYSGLWHQEEILVSEGDMVSAGQLIGKIGATGRVTGPHLHWEVWANGVQVDPIQWLDEEFPHE